MSELQQKDDMDKIKVSPTDMNIHGAKLTRRGFLGGAGTLMVSLALNPTLSFAKTKSSGHSLNATLPASWIEIHADNSVVIRTGKCDFGQSSIYTAYRQIVAEELCIPVESITSVISGDTDRTPDGGGTFGLLRTNVLNLRKVAAYTREAVIALSAEKFGVKKEEVTIKNGVISAGTKKTSYGDVVSKQALSLDIPVSGELTEFRGLVVDGEPPLKAISEYSIVGKPVKNPIVRPKVSGETTWVGDVKVPGMLHARVIHPATLGSTLIEAGKVNKTKYPNTQVVVVKNLVAVVSSDEYEAVKAAREISSTTKWTQWEGLPTSEGLEEQLKTKEKWTDVPPIKSGATKGDVNAKSAKSLQHDYFVPFHKHAPIGPTVSLAEVKKGVITVHTHSQNPQYLRMAIAKMLGEKEDNVVIRTYAGPGHFGRSNGGNAGSEDEAAILAHTLKVPVRVQWMRHDDMQWSTQSSAMHSNIRIGLSDDGKIATYQAVHSGPPMQDDRPIGAILAGLDTISPPTPDNPFRVHNAGLFIADTWVYEQVENVAETGRGMFQIGQHESPIGVGLRDHSMRTPIQFQQNFPREAAMNEAAALVGKDALQFRMEHVKEPRFKAILETLRNESGWDTRPSPAKTAKSDGDQELRGRGVSIMLRDNGYWACASHITVNPSSGVVKVERITLVCDPGIVVNPLQLKRQAEAGCLMGVSQTLHEEVAFDKGKITSMDWFSYPILKMAEVPTVKVVIAPDKTAKIYGQGSESANALVASSIVGAFYDATGKPIRRIPLRPNYVKQALA
ncbi:Nicotinate dehydrogenase subunit B [Thalassocella blandensis]|nr:Nicotinate dehydrogenase subunit B [Thalassocella blandensis]